MRADETAGPARYPLAVSPAEAADLAGLARTKMYELLASGAVPSLKVGKRRLILVAELEGFLLGEQARQAAEAAS